MLNVMAKKTRRPSEKPLEEALLPFTDSSVRVIQAQLRQLREREELLEREIQQRPATSFDSQILQKHLRIIHKRKALNKRLLSGLESIKAMEGKLGDVLKKKKWNERLLRELQ